MNAIQVRHLKKAFGKHTVLDDVSLSIKAGSIMGLIGNNGSGKSVLMKCICGLIIPDHGEIEVLGRQIGHDVDFPPCLGALIERPGFLPNRSGYDNLRCLWEMRPCVPKENIRKAIILVGLDPDDKKGVGKYSLGMRQRLGIALALLEDPEILILDEPFNGLDRSGTKEMRALLKDQRERGKTILIASHNPADISELCDDCCEMDAGRLSIVQTLIPTE